MAQREAVRVLLVSSHPVQYAVPLYRKYTEDPRLDIKVVFCSLQGAESGFDPDFGIELAWDKPMLDGYQWEHPRNIAPRPRFGRPFGLINPGLWSIVRTGNFDVVVCYEYSAVSFWIAMVAAKLSGAAVLFCSEAHTFGSLRGGSWRSVLKRFMLPALYRLVDGCLALSSPAVRFHRKLGLPVDRVFLTPYVVDNDFFSERAQNADRPGFRKRLGIEPDEVTFVYSGKLVPWKRPGDLLEALVRVPGAHLVIAGDGPLKRGLQARVTELGLTSRVHWLGFVNQSGLPDVLSSCDALLLPSEQEGFGVVVNEAFLCGLPVVVTDACGAAEDLVEEGKTGYVVPVGNVEVLAERMRAIAQDEELRAKLGRQARVRIENWGPDQNVEAFAKACAAVSQGRRSK